MNNKSIAGLGLVVVLAACSSSEPPGGGAGGSGGSSGSGTVPAGCQPLQDCLTNKCTCTTECQAASDCVAACNCDATCASNCQTQASTACQTCAQTCILSTCASEFSACLAETTGGGTYTCAELQTCCDGLTGTDKDDCNQALTSAMGSDAICSIAYPYFCGM